MKWISNGDPPLYVWEGDCWYDQKGMRLMFADLINDNWTSIWPESITISFPKKTKVKTEKGWRFCLHK